MEGGWKDGCNEGWKEGGWRDAMRDGKRVDGGMQ